MAATGRIRGRQVVWDAVQGLYRWGRHRRAGRGLGWGPSIKVAGCDDVLALCDTVESLRAAHDKALAEWKDRYHDAEDHAVDMFHQLETVTAERDELANVIAYEGVRELETLRGIAKRLADGWIAASPEHDLYLTKSEMHAIYGQKESDDAS